MDQEIILVNAISSLVENKGCFTCHGPKFSDVTWTIPLKDRPTSAKVSAKVSELEQLELDTQYQRDREEEYPPTKELIVALSLFS